MAKKQRAVYTSQQHVERVNDATQQYSIAAMTALQQVQYAKIVTQKVQNLPELFAIKITGEEHEMMGAMALASKTLLEKLDLIQKATSNPPEYYPYSDGRLIEWEMGVAENIAGASETMNLLMSASSALVDKMAEMEIELDATETKAEEPAK